MSGGIWLDNWRGLRNSALLNGAYNDALTQAYNINGKHAVWNRSNTAGPLGNLYAGISQQSGSSYGAYLVVRFGQSDTPPTAADYNLGDPVTSNLSYISVSSGSLQYDTATATVSRTYTATVQNLASASVTFREFGLFVYTNTISGESNSSTITMLYREVLDTPVTLAQYETATITFTVSLTLGDPVPGVQT